MAISPPSDIVLDVARAVDPAELAAARTQLAERARTGIAKAGFPEIAPAEVSSRNMADMRFTSHADAGKAGKAPEAYRKFEAVVLQNFMQSMMPKDSEAVYGKGLAGDMWKSELAKQLGTVLSERGGIGIANRLLKDHYMVGDKKVALTGASEGTRKDEADMRRMLSTALVQEIQRKLTSPLAAGDGGGKSKT
ncbi:MAG: rod-binding protein [Hyphomicrobiales bacterium]|nr:rod-binding protein [Hyphomicrobiales bacterium]